MKLRTRLIVFFLTLILTPAVFIGLIATPNANRAVTQQAINHLESLSSSKETEVEIFIQGEKDRLKGITSRTKLRNTIKEWLENPSQEGSETIKDILTDAQEPFPEINWILILDPSNQLISSTSTVDVATMETIKNTVSKNVGTEGLFYEKSSTETFMSGPIYLDGDFVGTAVVNFATSAVHLITNDYTGLGETGEILLARRNEFGDAEFLHPRRFEDSKSAQTTISKESLEVPITQALLKKEVILAEAQDYRGEQVIAATRYIDNADWGLVVKIDDNELQGHISTFRITMAIISIIILSFSLIMALIIATTLSSPLEKLSTITKRVEKGDLDVEIPKELRKDTSEVGSLAQGFHDMILSLRDARRNLEEKVQARTKELQSTKKTLEEKLDETERLNAVMVNRELKMVELKEKIAELEAGGTQ